MSARCSFLMVENRDFARFSRRVRVVHFSCLMHDSRLVGVSLNRQQANPLYARAKPVKFYKLARQWER